ncbi:hypothetical protein FRACYDRAFT_244973 [Fragilariopsis cylindrus CCMP1102]|uniref:Uncharacterized protein n=1 Tax=Fragilariopsis cylindrus CCMP1102 TaxID=635003 RepID=A0A1E7F207_9STRA|nr:hypothetical protein FRACYDRAFT_244973 [Fragilariopsis cylindrus CCMP1102]|eukprot:OEU11853.1 hypothetical protein FRACYDRAFT_244973 [Fragilariopsis cylindrus CCMP1102]
MSQQQQQQQQQFVAADNNDDTSSQQSGSRSKSKKKGLIKGLGKSFKNVFSSSNSRQRRRKKRRKKREDGNDDDDSSWVSYGSEASMSSKYDYRDFDENGNPTTREEQWALSGGSGSGGGSDGSGKNNYKNNGNRNSNNRLPSSLALPKVEEGEDEDYDSDRHLGLGANSAHSAKERHTSGMNKMRKKFYTSPTKTKGDRGGGGYSSSISSSSRESRGSRGGGGGGGGGSKSRKNKKTKGTATATTAAADPLSLVVLLVDPISLRFELLSLDFDLASHITGTTPNSSSSKRKKSRNKNNKNNESEGDESLSSLKLTLTVQDVLDQITSESLTEETLKSNSTKKRPIGLIDRTEKIHYGTSNLDIACSSRPCPSRSTMSSGITKSLCDLTYSGEPHRDVLLGYFSDTAANTTDTDTTTNTDNTDNNTEVVVEVVSNEKIQKAIKLSKPIFMDPKVIQLMQSNGYNLSGWNGTIPTTTATTNKVGISNSNNNSNHSSSSAVMLGKPLPVKKRSKNYLLDNIIVKIILGLFVLLFATIMASSIVYGGLYVLPSPTPSTATSSSLTSSNTNSSTTTTSINNNLPHTFEGYIKFGYNSLSSWITPKSFLLEQQQQNDNVIEDTRSDDNKNVRSIRDDDDNDNDNEIIDLDL